MASRLSPQAACRYRSPGPPVRGEAVQCLSPQAGHRQIHPTQAWGGVGLQRVNSYEPASLASRHGSPTPTTARSTMPALLHSPQQPSRQGPGELTARPHWLRNDIASPQLGMTPPQVGLGMTPPQVGVGMTPPQVGVGMTSPQHGMTTRVPSNANLRGGLVAPSAMGQQLRMPQGPGLPQTRVPNDVSGSSQPKNHCGLQDDTQQLDRVFVDTANLARVREEAEQHRHRAEQLVHREMQLLAELDAEQRKYQNATQRLDHMERKLLAESETSAQQREEIRKLQDESDKAKKRSQHLEKEYAEQNMKMEEYLDKIMGENGRKEKEIARSQQEISQLKHSHVEAWSEHRNSVDGLSKEVRELRDEKATLSLRYRSLEAQLDDYRRKCKELEQRYKQSEERIPELERHCQSSQDEINGFHSNLEQQERRHARATEQKEAELQAKQAELQAKEAEIQSYQERESRQREREAQQVAMQEAERAKVQQTLQEFTRAVESSGGADSLRGVLARLNASLAQQDGQTISSAEAAVLALGRALEALLVQVTQREASLSSRMQEVEYERQAVETRVMQRAKQDAVRQQREYEAVLREREREDVERSQQQSFTEVEVNKENIQLKETVQHQSGLIRQLEGQLKIESAGKHLTPAEAERILKRQQDHLLSENQGLHLEVADLKRRVGLSHYKR